MTGQTYNQVLTQLAESYEVVMRDDGLDVQLKINAICAMALVNWLDGYTLSQDLNLLDC